MKPGDGDPRHGTANGYSNLGCRCGRCKRAWAKDHLDYMHRNAKQQERHRAKQRERRKKGGQ